MKLNLQMQRKFAGIFRAALGDYAVMYKWAERMEELRKAKKLSRRELAEMAGLKLGQLSMAARGKVQNPRGDFFFRVARVLGTSESYLRLGIEDDNTPSEIADPSTIHFPVRSEMPQDVPVMGNGTGGIDGAMNFNGPIDHIRRPQALARSRDIYAVYVSGDSMEPRYFAGDPVIVSPHRPLSISDHVIVQCMTPDGDLLAFVKVITGRGRDGWKFGQYNPAGEWVPPWPVQSVHRIFNNIDILGT